MTAIENLSPHEFSDYLKKFGNTICGRHVIGILLNVSVCMIIATCNKTYFQMINLITEDTKMRPNLKFLNYMQSNQCITSMDSSVSYAAGALIM